LFHDYRKTEAVNGLARVLTYQPPILMLRPNLAPHVLLRKPSTYSQFFHHSSPSGVALILVNELLLTRDWLASRDVIPNSMLNLA
jgi:hypothetical protein